MLKRTVLPGETDNPIMGPGPVSPPIPLLAVKLLLITIIRHKSPWTFK